ncbi:hypothetical protein, partial [Escherichia coli]
MRVGAITFVYSVTKR